eukprot:SAG11_NODE_99_length_16913_cov_41.552813_9_plen_158_part_00
MWFITIGVATSGVAWLSQYPLEREILISPLSGLEVLSAGQLRDKTLVYTMGLNINLRSKTIEEVRAARKGQWLELAEVVHNGIEMEYKQSIQDAQRTRWLKGRLEKVEQKVSTICNAGTYGKSSYAEIMKAAYKSEEVELFNDDVTFSEAVRRAMPA